MEPPGRYGESGYTRRGEKWLEVLLRHVMVWPAVWRYLVLVRGEAEVDDVQQRVQARRRQLGAARGQRGARAALQQPHQAHQQVAVRLAVERRPRALRSTDTLELGRLISKCACTAT